MRTIYQDAVRETLSACRAVRENTMDVERFQNLLWDIADRVSSADEKLLRERLRYFEGRIELARFTHDDREVRGEIERILDEVELFLRTILEE